MHSALTPQGGPVMTGKSGNSGKARKSGKTVGTGGAGAAGHGVDRALLDVLVCPVTHGPLEFDAGRNELVSHQLGRAFPIRDGVPVMIVEEARELSEAERAKKRR